MTTHDTSTTARSAFDEAIEAMPTCALDEEGVRAQRRRYARLAEDVTRIAREPAAMIVEFRENFDRATLEEALAVERECCPFFLFDLDGDTRRLRTTVRERDQLPALDALAHAYGAAQQAHSSG